jgi:DNA-binding response OmpR family regulator
MARVLIIEPDRPLRRFIAGILADFGHDVHQATGPADALKQAKHTTFDAIVTDLVLGAKADQLSALAKEVRIVTLSGRTHRDPPPDRRERRARLTDKPFRSTDLRALVEALDTPRAIAA